MLIFLWIFQNYIYYFYLVLLCEYIYIYYYIYYGSVHSLVIIRPRFETYWSLDSNFHVSIFPTSPLIRVVTFRSILLFPCRGNRSSDDYFTKPNWVFLQIYLEMLPVNNNIKLNDSLLLNISFNLHVNCKFILFWLHL